jgi:hypothetical protein
VLVETYSDPRGRRWRINNRVITLLINHYGRFSIVMRICSRTRDA